MKRYFRRGAAALAAAALLLAQAPQAQARDLSLADAIAQATPTSPWHPTSAPEIEALRLNRYPTAPAVSRNVLTPSSSADSTKCQ